MDNWTKRVLLEYIESSLDGEYDAEAEVCFSAFAGDGVVYVTVTDPEDETEDRFILTIQQTQT